VSIGTSFKRLNMRRLSGVLVGLALLAGCETIPQPYVPKPSTPPAVAHCNDYTGHLKGATPWALGGGCTCTPSPTLMAKLHADGICPELDEAGLRKLYLDKGIVLRGPKHRYCNGMCSAGPHVVLGGRCMAPPTPGTERAEIIITRPRVVVAGSTTNTQTP